MQGIPAIARLECRGLHEATPCCQRGDAFRLFPLCDIPSHQKARRAGLGLLLVLVLKMQALAVGLRIRTNGQSTRDYPLPSLCFRRSHGRGRHGSVLR